jgi:hypothetical protein
MRPSLTGVCSTPYAHAERRQIPPRPPRRNGRAQAAKQQTGPASDLIRGTLSEGKDADRFLNLIAEEKVNPRASVRG